VTSVEYRARPVEDESTGESTTKSTLNFEDNGPPRLVVLPPGRGHTVSVVSADGRRRSMVFSRDKPETVMVKVKQWPLGLCTFEDAEDEADC
jgi:hypothetical protein